MRKRGNKNKLTLQEDEDQKEPMTNGSLAEHSGPAKKIKSKNSKVAKTSKQKPSFIRQCLGVLKYAVLLLIVPPFLNYAALIKENKQLLPEVGLLYDLGFGQKMFMSCMGNGTPTVILDAPTGMSSDVWALVQPQIAKHTKVCVYDRAGLGFSDRPYRNYSEPEPDISDEDDDVDWEKNRKNVKWQEFTVERMVDDMHRLFTYSSQQERPLILVGSEMGSLVARFYAQIYEGDVAGLVLIDPLVENIFEQDSGVWAQFWFHHLLPSFQSLQLAAATGISRLALILKMMDQPISGEDIPDTVIGRQKHNMCNPKHLSSVVDEHHFINDTFSQIQTVWRLKPFPANISTTVITGNYYDEQLPSSLNKAWAKSQQHLISRLHPGSNHIVVNGADHHMLYRHPEAVVEPIKRLVRQTRSRTKAAKY